MSRGLRDQGGSALIMAVIAMLILGVLGVSFALLANIESTIGVNYKQQAQAEALAEAGLARARDAVRTAAAESCGFTRWTSTATVGTCGSPLGKLLFGNVALGPGTFSAVIDNDCNPLVPTGFQDGNCSGGTPALDGNETAVITAFASSATGRSRVRAVVRVDNPWKHVCSNSSQDNPPGYCNEPANRNGTPTITPADPNDPNGPAGYDDLPRPTLGCSAIDPLLHDPSGNCPRGENDDYPYTPGRRYVVQGPWGAGPTKNCDGGGQSYAGYFDCALTTPCDWCTPAVPACVVTGDSRINGVTYMEAVGGVCPPGATGSVLTGNTNVNVDVGAANDGRNVYVMNGDLTVQNNRLHGVWVIEGNGIGGCGASRDLWHKNQAKIWTETQSSTHQILGAGGGGPRSLYGYPIAYLIYDPDLAAPTANPLAPQDTCADMGSAAGTEIHGMVYSGGHVEFNPIAVDGSIVAFEIQTQASASVYGYNAIYGNAAPPGGFLTGSGTQVVVVRKSFMACSTYADDSAGGTACQ